MKAVQPLPAQTPAVAGTSKGAESDAVTSMQLASDRTDGEFTEVRRKGLSGAARKRKRMLKEAGLSDAEASAACSKPWKEAVRLIPPDKLQQTNRAVKRTRSEEASPKGQPKKHPKTQTESSRPNFKEVAGSTRVGIQNTSPMNEVQMRAVHDSILAEIGEMENGTGPQFLGLTHKTGWIQILCEDMASQEWLAKITPNLKPWPEAMLTFMSEKELPKPTIATTFFPSSEAPDMEKALNLLSKQNKGLSPENWRILNSRQEKNGKLVTFSIDEPSVEALRKKDLRATLGFGKIIFKIQGETGVRKENRTGSTNSTQSVQLQPSLQKNAPGNPPTATFNAGIRKFPIGKGRAQNKSQPKGGHNRAPEARGGSANDPATGNKGTPRPEERERDKDQSEKAPKNASEERDGPATDRPRPMEH